MQETRSKVNSLALVTKAEVVKSIAGLLRRCLSLAQDICRIVTFLIAIETSEMTQVLASHTGNHEGIHTGGWGGVFPKSSSSLFLVILLCLYVLWIKAPQLIIYLKLQGKLPSPQLFQNHCRRDHRQVWLFRVTCQDLQPSSYNLNVTMTCWYQSFVIKPDDIPKALLCHLAGKPGPIDDILKVSPRHLASNPDQYRWWGWRLHKRGASSIASNQPLRLHAIQWCFEEW